MVGRNPGSRVIELQANFGEQEMQLERFNQL